MAEEQEEATAVPDFTVIFTKMRESMTPELEQNVALSASQSETLRMLEEAVPEGNTPYVTTFLST